MASDKFESEIDDWMEELGSEDNPFDDAEQAATAAEAKTTSSPDASVDAAPIDQAAINALMDGADEPAEEPEDQGPVDQATIDALMGGSDNTDPNAGSDELNQADLNALLMGVVEEPKLDAGSDELNQADLDALLNDSDGAAESSGDEEPVDQATIDVLMGGPDETDLNAGGSDELNQADLDALLNGSDNQGSADDASISQVDQAEIDALFSSTESDDITAGQEERAASPADFDALLGDSDGSLIDPDEGPPSQTEMDQLFATESDDGANLFATESTSFTQSDENFDFGGNELSDSDDAEESPGASVQSPADHEETVFEKPKEKKKFIPPAWLINKLTDNRAKWTGIGIVLVLLLGTGGYFGFLKKDASETAIPVTATDMTAEQTAPVESTLPPQKATLISTDIEIAMGTDTDTVLINLDPKDGSAGRLDYLITSLPTQGSLQGSPPELTYTPAPGFSGKDSFAYRVSNGREMSPPATITITGEVRLAQTVPSEPKLMEPRMPLVNAMALSLETVSTASLTIDWAAIWERANGNSFGRKAGVEILGKAKHGVLSRLNRTSYAYAPDPYDSGTEQLSYRFVLAGVKSKTRQIKINVLQGDPPPALKINPLEQDIYAVGDAVLIDASDTRDDDPGSLRFSWQQLAGIPVRFQSLNQNGSMISFVVPSSFYTAPYPKPVLLLTAADKSGQKTTEKITINASADSQASEWNGLHSYGLARLETSCPEGDCRGGILPWGVLAVKSEK